jgi:signal transduction histidine kinase
MSQALSQQPSKPPISETHVLKMLSRGAPINEILNELCNFIDLRSPGVIPTVLLPHRDGMHLRLAAGPKVPEIWNEAFDGLKVPSYDSFQAAAPEGNPVPVADVRSDPSFAACWDVVSSQGVQAAWSVPIVSGANKILGAMILFYPTAYQPTQRDLALIEQVIHMAAIAIECHRSEEELREFSRRLYQSQDDERRRIARELHDSTGQKLAVLGIKLSEVESTIPTEGEPIGTLSECTSLTRSIADEIRTLSYLLHPPLLDECGLYTAIHWYVDGINQRHGLHVDVEIPQNLPRLSEDAELAIFRIVQASLTNVHLHSKARGATVRIEQVSDGVMVEVRDDGQGIPDGVLNHSSRTQSVGVGITGMRERAEELGGHLEIETGSNGTTVKATIPSRNFRLLP